VKRILLATSVLAAMLFARPSAAAGGVNLAWNNCASEGGTANLSSACDSNSGVNVLTGSFVLSADLPGVTGVEIVLDLIVGDGTSPVPPWWEMEFSGCRAGSIAANGVVNPANTVCSDWANGAAAGGLAAYTGSYGGSGLNPANYPAHRRIIAGFAVAAVNSANLISMREYFAFNLLISNIRTVGSPSCAGCDQPACIVLNSMNVVTHDTGVHENIKTGTFAGSNFATWQGVGPMCQLVPTKKATWGGVKALYR
jgi:hypothetical protein